MDDSEVLVELWKGTGARVTERRSYEWKIAFGLWTAQLATISVLLLNSDKLDLGRDDFFAQYLAAGLALSALHSVYVFGFIRRRNHYESNLARAYEADLHDALPHSVSQRTKTIYGEVANTPPNTKGNRAPYTAANWFAVAVTTFLAVIGPLAIEAVGRDASDPARPSALIGREFSLSR